MTSTDDAITSPDIVTLDLAAELGSTVPFDGRSWREWSLARVLRHEAGEVLGVPAAAPKD